jgi:hypothetical protein
MMRRTGQHLFAGNRDAARLALLRLTVRPLQKNHGMLHKFKLSEQHQVFNSLFDKLSVTCGGPSFSAGVLLEQL